MAWGWRGRGWGGGGWAGPWPGRGPFSYLPPWQRPGWLFGFGRGFGRGRWGGYPYSPWVCARFPWLPRWWWAYPGYGQPYATYGAGYGYGLPYMAYGGGYGYPYAMYPWSFYGVPGYEYPYMMHPYGMYGMRGYGYPPAPYMGYW